MRVVVTGGTGFIGSAIVRRLLATGDDVLAIDRVATGGEPLRAVGAAVVEADLVADGLARHLAGADAVVHAAGDFRIGIPPAQRRAMTASNVTATERVLDAAAEAGVPHVVHVSTFGVYGDTRGRIVDETYRRPAGDPYLSWYDETKHRAHLEVERRRAAGAPVSIVLPGAAYGPGDPSGLGDQVRRAARGKLPAVGSPTLGVSWTHVDDLADGVGRVLRARPGDDWNLGGELGTLRSAIDLACRLAGRRPPGLTAPAPALLALARLGPAACARLGFPANLAEAVACTDGVTYWASHEKASRAIGYDPRPMSVGFRQTFAD